MRKTTLLLAAVAALSLAGCVNNPNSPTNNAAVRTIGGAATGAVIAGATGGSKTQGALIGAVAGVGSCYIPGTAGCS